MEFFINENNTSETSDQKKSGKMERRRDAEAIRYTKFFPTRFKEYKVDPSQNSYCIGATNICKITHLSNKNTYPEINDQIKIRENGKKQGCRGN